MRTPGNLNRLDDFEVYTPSQLRALEAQSTELWRRRTHAPPAHREWTCRIIAAAIMLETLFYKFTGAEESVYIFSKMHTDPWWRWGQGIWELLAAIGLLTPRYAWAGGILTTGAMGAAILSHMTWLGFSILGDRGLLLAWRA